MNAVSTARNVIRYTHGAYQEMEDTVATEFAITILLNDEEFATLVCSPDHLDELAVGFLASEGVIANYEDIEEMSVDAKDGFAYVRTRRVNQLNKKFHSKRYITSCCGKGRQSFYFYNDAKTVKTMTERQLRLTADECLALMGIMQKDAALFQETGGVHNAALCDKTGTLITRTDIGRHNALDKIYGSCLMQHQYLTGKAMVFSGRISSEVLLKVAKIGCEIVLSKSAPTALALDMAEELGITAVGFIRNGSFNVYTHPERIIQEI